MARNWGYGAGFEPAEQRGDEMELGLEGRRAVVTGSTGGLGEATARALAAEGVSVMIHGLDEVDAAAALVGEITDGGGRAASVLADLGSEEGAARVVDAAREAFGGVDILVNNAVAARPEEITKAWLDVTPEEWRAMLDTGFLSAIRLARLTVPAMVDQDWGRVVQISTSAALAPGAAGAHYAATKAAMANATVSLCKALVGTGVTVNTVAPGPMDTPGSRALGAYMTQRPDLRPPGEGGGAPPGGARPRGAMAADPARVAAMIVFLASDAAANVSGTNIRVDTGISASMA